MNRRDNVNDLSESIIDFEDTAVFLSQMDLVISVDTAVTHLAGALGRPAWTLLPYAADWRWRVHRADSPWYETMRLFRQQRAGDWDQVLEEVSHCLFNYGAQMSTSRLAGSCLLPT
jgi:ADP-heptose:LPS heptosyltransferase